MDRTKKDETLATQVRNNQLSLPFDQYQRYRMVADVVELLREDADSLRILDVGGGEGIIVNFLPEDGITILDQQESEGMPGLVQGDATALPFEDGAFDYVVSVDVYEHIEPGSRERYLSELRRTARRGVLLAAPFDSEVVRSAEQVANDFHRFVHLEENRWLKEHAENGLPRLDDARRFFDGRGDAVSVLPNGYIPHWLAMMCLTFYSSKLKGESGTIFERINAFYNEFMYNVDNAEPCYRYLLVSLKEPVNIDLDELASPAPGPERTSHSSALVGTFSAMLPVTTEVKQLSAEAKQLNAEVKQLQERLAKKEGAVARKEAQVNNLTRRLAERVGAMNSSWIQTERRTDKLQQDHNRLKQIHNRLKQDHNRLKSQRDQLHQEMAGITGSRAWRLLTVLHKARLAVGNVFRSG